MTLRMVSKNSSMNDPRVLRHFVDDKEARVFGVPN